MKFKDIDFNQPIELYSIQAPEQLDNLKEHGFITGSDKHRIGNSDEDEQNESVNKTFTDSYKWMSYKMINKFNMKIPDKVLIKQTNPYPIWFWYSYTGQSNRRPDLRYSCYAERGTPLVLLTFKKRWSEILLSDFEMWHCILNKQIIAHNELFKDIEKILDTKYRFVDYYDLPKKYQRLIEQSWNIIFDMSFEDSDWTEPFQNKILQGTTWLINESDVLAVKHFNAK